MRPCAKFWRFLRSNPAPPFRPARRSRWRINSSVFKIRSVAPPRKFCVAFRTYPIARLDALVAETTCFGQLVRPHSSFDRCRWRPPGPLPALCKSDTGFQFPATTLNFLRIPKQGIALLGLTPIAPQASRKACSFLSVNSFIMYLPGVRTPFQSILLIRTLSRPFGRFGSPDFDRRGFDARPLHAAFERTA